MAISTVNDIADYLLFFAHEHGDQITPLKLQKLVFYADAWYMALNDDRELIQNQFEAWVCGPVVRELYTRFARYQWRPIDEELKRPELPEEVAKHLDEVYQVFGGFSLYELEQLTQQEKPWRIARKNLPDYEPCTNLISKKITADFYRSVREGKKI
ncbi:Panacea domain-containing protein [Escherichia coli]